LGEVVRDLPARSGRFARARVQHASAVTRNRVLRRDDERFDATAAIDVSGWLTLDRLTVAAGDRSEGNLYVAEPIDVARWWRRTLPERLDEYTFVDMGSGKGRMLFFAVEQGFGKAVGVEFARELHEAAEANRARSRLPGTERVELVHGDAGAYEFPTDPLVVHFNNPFHEGVMRRVIDQLGASYSRRARPVICIYQQHRHEPPETKTGNVGLLAAVPFLRHRALERERLLDRWLVHPNLVDVFESPEVAGVS
jgi:SAM-dependent methyltransferase